MAISIPFTDATHGTVSPYPKRTISDRCMSTEPETPSTTRTTCGLSSRTGMQSMRRTVPVAVSNSVSRTSVSSR